MRCINCGYDNSPGHSVCLKCGHSLQPVESNYGQMPNDNRNSSTSYRMTERGIPRPTVIGVNTSPEERKTVVLKQPEQDIRTIKLVTQTQCVSCGYPIVANYLSCPNCGIPLNEHKKEEADNKDIEKKDAGTHINGTFKCQHCQQEIALSSTYCPYCGQRVHAPTILPSQLNKIVSVTPQCCLTILPEENEFIDKSSNVYSGESVILNRMNTEESNCTITTQKQAELKYEDGEWYLQNLSEHQTTYLILNRRVQLKDGDIIIMGNRKFKFEKK